MPPDDRQREESKLDETIEESFPASDPPANTVETGVHLSAPQPSPALDISDNRAKSRLELEVDGHVAFLDYERRLETFTLIHTEVPPELRGRHLGPRLVEAALQIGRSEGKRIVVVCPFARVYLRRHPRFAE